MDEVKHLLKFGFQFVGRDGVVVHQAGKVKDFSAFGDQVAAQ
jgi:hypothetical protein